MRRVGWVVLLLAIGCSGCAVRQVYRDGNAGVVALPANTNIWPFRFRDRANEMMSSHFPDGYEVVSEGEEVIGQTTTYDEETAGGVELFDGVISVGSRATSGSATTTDETEYRIRYQRR